MYGGSMSTFIEITEEQSDEIVVESLSSWIVDLLDEEDTTERWDMITNLFCALQYYLTHEQLVEFMEDYPELAEMLDWNEDA